MKLSAAIKHDALVLVTRSGAEGRRLCCKLQECGIPNEHFAPICLAGPEDPHQCRRKLLSSLPCHLLIVPSAEALRQAHALVGTKALAATPLIVPGPGTAQVARSLGFAHVEYPCSGGTSEQILQMPVLQDIRRMRVLILAAAGGREQIARELDRRGALVERLHVYRRLPQSLPPVLEARLLACSEVITLVASGGALAGLETALGPAAWTHLVRGLMIVPSPRVAMLARAAGADEVLAADGADDASMLRALARARSELNVCVTLA